MHDPLRLVLILLAYAGALLGLALYVERGSPLARRLTANPLTYSLALGVYCTSWTYYGSVGSAVQSGLLFMALYLGPAVACALWGVLLPRFVRVRNVLRIASLADFLAARYGKSQALASLTAAAALVGITPYISLQLKSIVDAFGVIGGGPDGSALPPGLLGPGTALFLTLLTIAFGLRRLDPAERHPGLVAVLALESLIKLGALLALGLFTVYGMNRGPADLFARLAGPDGSALIGPGSGERASYMVWTSHMILAGAAVMFLPRQFHVSVVENEDPRHVRPAMWLLPLYLLLISLFALPIAAQGVLQGLPASQADTFVLRLPLSQGRPGLALLVFLGGFSASLGMIMVSATTLATMTTNHLLLPLIRRFAPLAPLRQRLLGCRRAAAAGVLLLAWLFGRVVGDAFMLVGIGMMSFAAALQFAPAMLGAALWPRASTRGAMAGMCAGFAVWAYCLILPSLAHSGLLPPGFVHDGPFGLRLLRPQALLGLEALDPLSHTIFWSMLLNAGLLVLVSLSFGQGPEERQAAQEFAEAARPGRQLRPPGLRLARSVPLPGKRRILLRLARAFLPPPKARELVNGCVARCGLAGRRRISVAELAALRTAMERALSGPLGPAAAHQALAEAALFTPGEEAALSEAYGRVLGRLKLPPERLLERIDLYREREELNRRHAEELEERVRERTAALARKAGELEEANRRLRELDRLKSAFLSSVSHELRTPLTSILGFSRLIAKEFAQTFAPLLQGEERLRARAGRVAGNLGIIEAESRRLTRLINDVLDLSKIEEGRLVWRDEPLSAHGLVRRSLEAVGGELAQKPEVELRLDLMPRDATLLVDGDRLQQVLINLLNNAVKFTARGRITVAAARLPDGGLRLSVADTGPGIPAADLERVFDKFHQVAQGDTLVDKPRGTGLGLAICRRIVRHYDGSIRVESAPGRGSTFIVELPPAIVADAPEGAPPDAPPGAP